jgi:HEAT repeat protein
MAHVFISYAHADADFVVLLKSELEKAGFLHWIDSDQLRAGEDWREAIDDGIKSAFVLIVIMSPKAKASHYVMYEWAYALGTGIKVIPVLLRKTKLHLRLEPLQYIDFTDFSCPPWKKLTDRLNQIQAEEGIVSIPIPLNTPIKVRRILESLNSWDRDEREKAATLIGEKHYVEGIPALIALLRDEDHRVRIVAAKSLGEIGSSDAVSGLVAALSDEFWSVRYAIVKALRRIQSVKSTDALLNCLHDSAGMVRETAAIALIEIGDKSIVQSLLEMLKDDNPNARMAAAWILGRMDVTECVAALVNTLYDENSSVRAHGAGALGEYKNNNAIQALSTLLYDKSFFTSLSGQLYEQTVSEIAKYALETIGTPEALSAVERWKSEQGNIQG